MNQHLISMLDLLRPCHAIYFTYEVICTIIELLLKWLGKQDCCGVTYVLSPE